MINEFILPRPNVIIKDKKTGKYGKVLFFQWHEGETTHIPVQMDDRVKSKVSVIVFPRKFDIVDEDSSEYKQYLKDLDIKKKEKEMQDEISALTDKIQSMKKELKYIKSNKILYDRMVSEIVSLKFKRNKLMKKMSGMYG